MHEELCTAPQLQQFGEFMQFSEASLALPRRYEYAPMHRKNQARLFHLNPGDQGYPISGFIRTVSVEELSKTKYEAVSYVWGDPLSTVDIFAMDFDQGGGLGVLSITQSLYDALRKLRFRDAISIIWADGICINQEDLAERGHQVSIMRDIYTMADRVLVWLGPDPDGDSHVVFKLIDQLLEIVTRYSYPGWDYHFWIAERKDHRGWGCLARIQQRPWFTRIWILREIGVAADATFFCGDEVIERNQLFAAFRTIECYKPFKFLCNARHPNRIGQKVGHALSVQSA